ncbi:MAG: hypothetical protein ABI167_00770 [Nitrosospira sp.]
MNKITERAVSSALLHWVDCARTFIRFSGSAWLCPLYIKLSQASREIRDGAGRPRIAKASHEQEGLGAAYDKRNWYRNYYEKPPVRS